MTCLDNISKDNMEALQKLHKSQFADDRSRLLNKATVFVFFIIISSWARSQYQQIHVSLWSTSITSNLQEPTNIKSET